MDNVDKQKRLHEEVKKTLEIMDRWEDIETGPFFYERLRSEITRRQGQRRRWSPRKWIPAIPDIRDLFRPLAPRPVFLVLLILLNVVTALLFLAQPLTQSGTVESGTIRDDRSAGNTMWIEDYSLDRNTYDSAITEKMAEQTGDD